MSKLENLVPPLELCKQIPEGIFSDSAFWRVWSSVEQRYILCQRGIGAFANTAQIPCPCGMKYTYPAPTLAEILDELARHHTLVGVEKGCDGEWRASGWRTQVELDQNPTTAALKLWLEIYDDHNHTNR